MISIQPSGIGGGGGGGAGMKPTSSSSPPLVLNGTTLVADVVRVGGGVRGTSSVGMRGITGDRTDADADAAAPLLVLAAFAGDALAARCALVPVAVPAAAPAAVAAAVVVAAAAAVAGRVPPFPSLVVSVTNIFDRDERSFWL